MRLFCLVIFCLFWSPFSYAYMDINEEEEVTAGEHNTSMYRLNSQNTLLIKKLKQIDDILSKDPNSDLYTNQVEIENLLQNSEKDNEKKELKDLLDKAIYQTENIKELINDDSDVYQQILSIAGNTIKDIQVLNELNFGQKGGRI